MKYNSLQVAIPGNWKEYIKDNLNFTNYHVYADSTVKINNNWKKLIELTTKEMYQHIISTKQQRAASVSKWQNETE